MTGAISDDLPDNAGLHTASCLVWTSHDPVDTCDCGADAPSYAELERRDNAPIDAWQDAQDDYERQLFGGAG